MSEKPNIFNIINDFASLFSRHVGMICEICEICVRKKQIKIFRNSLAVTKIIPNFVADLCSATSVTLEKLERVLSLLA